MIQAKAIKNIPFTGKNVEVTELIWNYDGAVIDVYCPSEEKTVKVRFKNEFGSCAVRLLDETDLSDYWKNLNMSGGWLYKVTSGGWFDSESQRDGFIMRDAPGIEEFMVVGLDACVSVFTKDKVELLSGDGEILTEIAT